MSPAPVLMSLDGIRSVVISVCMESLECSSVTDEDSFISLGGDSIAAIKASHALSKALGIEISQADVLDCPSLGDLVTLIQKQKGGAASIVAASGGDGSLPASFAQSRLWLLAKIDGATAHYNMPIALAVRGALQRDRLGLVLTEIIRRHEVLRTTYSDSDTGGVVQTVQPLRPLPVETIILDVPDPAVRKQQLQRLIEVEALKPFSLLTDTMLRATVISFSSEDHVLLLTMHHIASDGWSVSVLLRELAELYGAPDEVGMSAVPALPVQYADYAQWQRSLLSGDVMEELTRYWTGKLAELPSACHPPTDRPRPRLQTFTGKSLLRGLAPEAVARIRKRCRAEGATLFMGLQAVFSALLARYTGESDIVIGTSVANREHSQTSKMIGLFINNVVLRTDLSGDLSFSQLLRRSKETLLGAYTHQQMPFERLVEVINPERSLSRTPLFQVMLMLEDEARYRASLPGMEVAVLDREERTAKYDLTLRVVDRRDRLSLEWNFNTDLFEPATIERMAGHFERLLDGLTASPETPFWDVELLSAAERAQQLVTWNATGRAYPSTESMVALFESQVSRSPEAIALVFGDERVSYGELNAQANQLAHLLLQQGHVGAERCIGVCMRRSPQMVAALLAVLKAGGAYVPLDPDYPAERLEYMLQDAGLETVLTLESLESRRPVGSGEWLCLDAAAVRSQLAVCPVTDPSVPGIGPSSLAYVIYTSGSTGQPKGVMIEHRNASALIHWAHRAFTPAELASVLASTSICFDLSVFELFVPLTCGGRVVLVENALALSGHDVPPITLINTVPSAIESLLDSGWLPSGVLAVNLAGERLRQETVEALFAAGVLAVNDLYGPSEDTTYSTFARRRRGGRETIGQPIDNTRAYVLDGRQNLVPAGTPGELYLAGAGVARGYLGRPELTAERFISNPFHDPSDPHSSARLYRTGDVVRWLAGGELEYLGRTDQQVKIRGFRIEPGEVESALLATAGVDEALVLAHADESGQKRLVGYYRSESLLEPDTVRAGVASVLPDYMVPSYLIRVDRFALTPNGKVDRKALPAPSEAGRGRQDDESTAPRTPIERQLHAIWKEILGTEHIGFRDDFFMLGGHSLSANRMISRVNSAMGVQLNVQDLFEAPQLADLCATIEIELKLMKKLQLTSNAGGTT